MTPMVSNNRRTLEIPKMLSGPVGVTSTKGDSYSRSSDIAPFFVSSSTISFMNSCCLAVAFLSLKNSFIASTAADRSSPTRERTNSHFIQGNFPDSTPLIISFASLIALFAVLARFCFLFVISALLSDPLFLRRCSGNSLSSLAICHIVNSDLCFFSLKQANRLSSAPKSM